MARESRAMNILLVGSGGREHALAWKITQSPLVTRLVAAPGNPGMAKLCEIVDLKPTEVARLVQLAKDIAADLVVIGPEVAIAAGLADALTEAGFPCFGPTAAAGRLESSKAFTKAFADRHGLPTAAYVVCEDAATAKAAEHARSGQGPYILEMKTYRYRGHSMSDPAKYRTREEVDEVRKTRDPIDHLRERLEAIGAGDEARLAAIDADVKAVVAEAVEFARTSPEPDPAALYTDVYAETTGL